MSISTDAVLLSGNSASPPRSSNLSSSSDVERGTPTYESLGGSHTPSHGGSNGGGGSGGRNRKRTMSAEFIYPSLGSQRRQASLTGAVFNLTATILGGGILSLPFCFELCGALVGTIILLAIAAASNFSIYILISCSRRVRHGASYEEVVATAFGSWAGRAVGAVLFALVYLVIVAYLILIRDLVTPLLELALGMGVGFGGHAAATAGSSAAAEAAADAHFGDLGKFFVVLAVLLAIMPLCLKRNMSSLSWLSVASIVPMAALCYAVVTRGSQEAWLQYQEPDRARFQGTQGQIKWAPTSWRDVIYGVPILACAYMCHFNVLPLHRELILPTRPRIRSMINRVIGICTSLYLTVGLFGYLYARGRTDGNILNNFRNDDPLAVLCRAAMAFTCIAGFPMCVLPCRNVAGKILAQCWPELALQYPVATGAAAMPAGGANGVRSGSEADQFPSSSSFSSSSNGSSSNGGHARSYSSSDFSAPSPASSLSSDSILAAHRFSGDPFASRSRIDAREDLGADRDHDPLEPMVDSDSEEEDDAFDEALDAANYERAQQAALAASQQMEDDLGEHEYGTHLYGSSASRRNASFSGNNYTRRSGNSSGGGLTVPPATATIASATEAPLAPPSLNGVSTTSLSTEASPLLSDGAASTYSGASGGSLGSIPLLPPAPAMLVATSSALMPLGNTPEPEFSDQSIAVQTCAICFSALLISCRVASVATLWNLVGSSACILLGYVLPSACYLRIRREKPLGLRMGAAWGLLVLGIVGLVICTMESFISISTSDAPAATQGIVPTAGTGL